VNSSGPFLGSRDSSSTRIALLGKAGSCADANSRSSDTGFVGAAGMRANSAWSVRAEGDLHDPENCLGVLVSDRDANHSTLSRMKPYVMPA
jgi:hypothetical protein